MKLTSTKRFAVRTALVTSTTLAAIVGAQALASLDEAAFSKALPATITPTELSIQPDNAVPTVPSQTSAAAPNIVILRHAGQVSAEPVGVPVPQPRASVPNSQPIIQPPNPVQVAAPQPIVQQAPQQSAPSVARTRSSR